MTRKSVPLKSLAVAVIAFTAAAAFSAYLARHAYRVRQSDPLRLKP
jgi:hypothetical protein